MIARNLIHKIRKTKGPIYVEITNFNDEFCVQAVKSDLISMLTRFDADEETGFELTEAGNFGKDYQSQDWK
jgi:hypothetical protein